MSDLKDNTDNTKENKKQSNMIQMNLFKNNVTTIPSTQIYPNPSNLYQKYVNRVFSSKSKLNIYPDKQSLLKFAESEWNNIKHDKSKIEEYLAKSPNTINFTSIRDQSSTWLTATKPTKENNLNENLNQEIVKDSNTSSRKRKTEEITENKFQTELLEKNMVKKVKTTNNENTMNLHHRFLTS